MFAIQPLLRRAALPAAAFAALLLTSPAAVAASGNHASHHPATPRAQNGHIIPVPASWLKRTPTVGHSSYGGNCTINIPGVPAGAYICGTHILGWVWSDGRQELFVVGTDNQVYHTFQTSNGGPWTQWYSFGGSASQGVFLLDTKPTFAVVGGGNSLYCQYPYPPNPSGWSGWVFCGNP
jgi:hypothetical protein